MLARGGQAVTQAHRKDTAYQLRTSARGDSAPNEKRWLSRWACRPDAP